MFASPIEHLEAELRRLDLLLHREILRLRAAYQLSLDEFRGLYVSDQQVDDLIRSPGTDAGAIPAAEDLTAEAESLHQRHTGGLAESFPWSRLAVDLNLSRFERETLLLAIAPDLDVKYETLFAYLNNDVTRRWPTRDLALRLFGRADPLAARRCLLREAPLFATGLLEPLEAQTGRPSWLARGFRASPAVASHLLGDTSLDPRLADIVELSDASGEARFSEAVRERLRRAARLVQDGATSGGIPVIVCEGSPGSGRAAAASMIGYFAEKRVSRIDAHRLLQSSDQLPEVLRRLTLHQLLTGSALALHGLDTSIASHGALSPEAHHLLAELGKKTRLLIVACPEDAHWRGCFQGRHAILLHFEDIDFAERRRLWITALEKISDLDLRPEELDSLADRFVLRPEQIFEAAAEAGDGRFLDGNSRPLRLEDLFSAARTQTQRNLGRLAIKVRLIHTWDDLVLPEPTLTQLREVAASVRNRHVVFTEWGFEQRLAEGKGVKVLFAGTSGTGKTMTAGVIARDLGLDLYKIDLSGVVSKYIGETEKNLDTIFRAARRINGILFFDEADALLGKRSEVKDAHDRYANIEIAYLLQKMEEYEGIAILATNLSKNIDQAFARRMHYVVEFPSPDDALRKRLWRGMFPPNAPLSEDLDFDFLAKQFSLTGGDIKNVALAAAFLAAEDGGSISMSHLVRALRRQSLKQGKAPSPAEYKQYHGLLTGGT